MVVELSIVETNKGHALSRIRQRVGATATIFFGDDVTDEDAFATLSGPDVAVKVGEGDSAAAFRVNDTHEASRFMARLAELRAAWIAGSHADRIDHHALLSDQRTFALVNPRGRVVWMCLPRLDAHGLFSELLGGPTAGFFEIAPENGDQCLGHHYLGDTFILETRWPHLRVTDYLDCSEGRPFQRAGRTDLIRVVEGQGSVRITFAPRLDFARTPTELRIEDGGLSVEGGTDLIVLRAPGLNWNITKEGPHQAAEAIVKLPDEPLVLELRYGTGNLGPSAAAESARRQQTEAFWSRWGQSLSLPKLHTSPVRRSALVLKALSYGPTGGMAAAATTSLPEHAGGVRNWDYRYCWPRDAALASSALVRIGSTGPAMRFLDWLLGILDNTDDPHRLRPVYTVTGGHIPVEADITSLHGYRGSRPVRIGNAAAVQVQLDVFGPILDLIATLAERGTALSSEHWRLVEMLIDAVQKRWTEPDHGIWEVRTHKRHYVYSKIMCWQTVDRGLRVAAYLGRKRPQWAELRQAIGDDVLKNGYSEKLRAFSGAYEFDELDAAALHVGLSGLLPPDDRRFISTVEQVQTQLRKGATVLRYLYDDGLPGAEGGFHLCTAWLIESLALIGRRDEARSLFDEYIRLAGPTGLMSEESDPENAVPLGNFPQAYSHLGLINCAVLLSQP
jgi:GH15 family glucan-1,4-alpha-glucosidase